MFVTLKVTLPAGFHVQSDAPLDPALVPTALTLTPPAGVTVEELIGMEPSQIDGDLQLAAAALLPQHLVQVLQHVAHLR